MITLCNHIGGNEPASRIYLKPPPGATFEQWDQFQHLLDGVYGVHDTYNQKSTADITICLAVDFVLNEISPEMLVRVANEMWRIAATYKVSEPD